MIQIQPQNTLTDILVARDYTCLNEHEQSLVRQSHTKDNPRLFLINQGLCIYHPEVVRALSMSNQELLRLISHGSDIPQTTPTPSGFEIIG